MTYLRARKSIKIAPGIKLNLNKSSVGLTVGTRGAHYSVNTKGTRTRTVGIPGTGISMVDRQSMSRAHAAAHGSVQQPLPRKPSLKAHAPLFASEHERKYARALGELGYGHPDQAEELLAEIINSETEQEAVAAHLITALIRWHAGDADGTIRHLEHVISTHIDREEEQLLDRYELPAGYDHFTVNIGAAQHDVVIPGNGPLYLLVAAYAKADRLQEAIGVMQQVIGDRAPGPGHLALDFMVLCTLYVELHEWDEIIHLVGHFGVTNSDDGTLALRLLEAAAMADSGLADAALEVLKDCLKSKKRRPDLLNAALSVRASIYLERGKTALARKDLSRIYAEDPAFPGVEARLKDLNARA